MSAYTEQQAKDKWCPVARVEDDTASANRNMCLGKQAETSCLGSKCAVWRWYDLPEKPERRGFCGLAPLPALPK